MSASSLTETETRSVLGKRKNRKHIDNYVLHLSSDAEGSLPSCSEFELSANETSSAQTTIQVAKPPLIVNGKLVAHTKKRYHCTHPGCEKAYTKPSRLEEHERSHSGTRPFECTTCHKTYLRETHLQAHMRSHLPESAKPLVCSEPNCDKRFWTNQHLRVHAAIHAGDKPFPCPEEGCNERFSKHHQLRQHACIAHAPPGTKPFRCEFQGCERSFDTNQHLRSHLKTHDDKRYTCIKPSCLTGHSDGPIYFPNWTALQHHMRTVHPPTCDHPSCNGKTFTSQKGLRAHQKIHSQQEINERICQAEESDSSDDDDNRPARKKHRRGGEYGRDWKCDVLGCTKDFKSKKALNTHVNVAHLGRRDFMCSWGSCKRAFGYKHLLQRHVARIHEKAEPSSDESSHDESTQLSNIRMSMSIEDMTGLSYAREARIKLQSGEGLGCPYPNLDGFLLQNVVPAGDNLPNCDYVFRRAYDLRRHLKAVHEIEVGKSIVDKWVRLQNLAYRDVT